MRPPPDDKGASPTACLNGVLLSLELWFSKVSDGILVFGMRIFVLEPPNQLNPYHPLLCARMPLCTSSDNEVAETAHAGSWYNILFTFGDKLALWN